MIIDDNSFVNQFDWQKESDVHENKLMDGSNFRPTEKLPAIIIVKIDKNDSNQTNKRTFFGVKQERLQP